jgi:RNA:NAD 2'-phosphotransferase (TPT1/KptA family)
MLTGAVVALAVGMWGNASSALSRMSTALRHFARAMHVRVGDDTSVDIASRYPRYPQGDPWLGDESLRS